MGAGILKLTTIASYWLLIALWAAILALYLGKLRHIKGTADKTIKILLVLLAIDAFRTLFESVYFSFYFSSMFGVLPESIFSFLSQPSALIVPKLTNLIAGLLMLVLLVRRWLPRELREREEWISTLQRSERKLQQSEKQLRRDKQALDEIIWATNVGTWEWVVPTGVTKINARWAEIVGFSLAELASINIDTWRALTHPDDLPRIDELLQKNYSGDLDYYELEFRMRHKNGHWIWVLARGKVVEWTADKKPLRMSGTHTDITQKRALQLSSERTSRMASIGTLAAGVAHEINNPNSVIQYNLPVFRAIWEDLRPALEERYRTSGDFILGGVDYSTLRREMTQLMSDCLTSSERIKRIVADLKNFAKDEKQGSDPTAQMEAIDLNQLVETASRLVMNKINTATDYFRLVLESDLPAAKGNFLRLEQVVINLLLNACLALSSKGQKIQVLTRFDKKESVSLIEVSDQGCGISEQDLPLILEPFYTTRRESGGTGLGLSISNNIIKEHGGHISISSKVGEGTSVRIILPTAIEEKIT